MKGHTGDIKNRGEGINFSVFFFRGLQVDLQGTTARYIQQHGA